MHTPPLHTAVEQGGRNRLKGSIVKLGPRAAGATCWKDPVVRVVLPSPACPTHHLLRALLIACHL